ncbi:hypothetical protein F2P81_000154 [Scophthalmus maximus]|uniref:Uncharacterized protein n=1 Tax=Scophthalmus maximus TaxID=52904 RepID=A0A6A4TV23_SCOMX|nr:hypothetical protein F2P81_000154 [Scophthalmus maximus]
MLELRARSIPKRPPCPYPNYRRFFFLKSAVTSPHNIYLQYNIYLLKSTVIDFAVKGQSSSRHLLREAVFVSGVELFAGGGSVSGSNGRRGVALPGPDPRHVFQLAGVGHVVARLVLGQDLHQWAELQPPLLLRDPVAGRRRKHEQSSHSFFILTDC